MNNALLAAGVLDNVAQRGRTERSPRTICLAAAGLSPISLSPVTSDRDSACLDSGSTRMCCRFAMHTSRHTYATLLALFGLTHFITVSDLDLAFDHLDSTRSAHSADGNCCCCRSTFSRSFSLPFSSASLSSAKLPSPVWCPPWRKGHNSGSHWLQRSHPALCSLVHESLSPF